MVKCKINYTLTVKSPTSVVKPMQPSFYLQMNSRIHRQRQRVSSSPRTHQPITLLSHTHQSHFSSNPCTTLNSTHSPMPSSGRPAKPRPAQIIPPPPPKSRHTIEITPRSHPLNLTAMLHHCMSPIHHRHHPSYPPPWASIHIQATHLPT